MSGERSFLTIPAALAAFNRSVVDLIQFAIIWFILIAIMASFLKHGDVVIEYVTRAPSFQNGVGPRTVTPSLAASAGRSVTLPLAMMRMASSTPPG
jgi:hypothetical protein